MSFALLWITIVGLFCCVVPVAPDCPAVDRCLQQHGVSLQNLLVPNSSKNQSASIRPIINFMCSKKEAMFKCYDELMSCSLFSQLIDYVRKDDLSSGQLNLICMHKNDIAAAVDCILKLDILKMKTPDSCLDKMVDLKQHKSIGSNSYCRLFQEVAECDPLTKAQVTCSARLFSKLHTSGTRVECLQVYEPASSGWRIHACVLLLLFPWIIILVGHHLY